MSKPTRISPFMKQCFVTAAVCCSIIGNTSSFGYPAVLLPQLEEPNSTITLSPEQASWIPSVTPIAMVVGNFVASSIMDPFGRRAACFAVALSAILGWLTMVLASSFEALFVGRILQGLSLGILLPVRGVLIGECTSPKHRGAFLATISLSQAFGIFFVHLIGSILSWQKTAIVFCFFPFTALVMTFYIPETPSYLASKGKYDECRRVFRWLRGDDEEQELEELIQARMLFAKEEKVVNTKDMVRVVKKKEFYKPVVLMIHAQSMMHFAGGTTMAAYSTVIISIIVGKDAHVNFWMIMFDTQRIISNGIAIYFINKYKRRVMMFSTGTICVLSHVAIAGYVYARINGFNYDAIWIGVVLINLQFFSVATGMVPLPNVINGEVFPLQYRSIGSTIGIVIGAIMNFTVLKTFPGLIEGIGLHGTYFLNAGFLTYFLTVIWFLLPETKGRTLQQIEDEFRGRALKPVELEAIQSLQLDKRKTSGRFTHSMTSLD